MNQFAKSMAALAMCAASFATCTQASAQSWPSHIIKAVIPFGAGSATDVVPRAVFDRMSAELGQTIVVENRTGAGGSLGTAIVAHATPDGYTILAHSSALVIAPSLYPNLTYDVTKDLSSVLMLGSSVSVMIVPTSRPWKTVQEFLEAARAKDAVITFGSVGIGSATHIAAEKFRIAAGFKATHVPYRGGAEVITDIMGGRIDFYFCPLSTALPLIQDGRVRALVVSSPKRVADLPDVPSPVDIGLKNADSVSWFGVFMPSKTPRDIIDKFHAAGVKVLAEPEMQAKLKKLAVDPMPMTPAEMDVFVKQELGSNAALLKSVEIKH
ncbi:MAG: tripartite tricarboxylate transporter substrate binding protein [Proteobacteria bacterium]|nr:tripartite tricarboxylate transporter substrate binding protein [Pseudomonadota bacterium]